VALRGGEVIPRGLWCWGGGSAGASLTTRFDLPTARQGRARGLGLRLAGAGHPTVCVIGDAAYAEANGRPSDDGPVAVQMAETAAANIGRQLRVKRPCRRYRDPGSLATIRTNAAVASIRGVAFKGSSPGWCGDGAHRAADRLRNKVFVLASTGRGTTSFTSERRADHRRGSHSE